MIQLKLKPEIEEFIDRQISAGNYTSKAELVEAAVANLMFETVIELPPDELEELRTQIAVGLAQATRGECGTWDAQEIRDEGRKLLEASKKRAG
jgi:Arc/MetJ-type ribon-helix-helix transcriptional regulator